MRRGSFANGTPSLLIVLVGMLLMSLAAPAVAAQSLLLSSQNGGRGSSFTGTYTTDATGCPDGTVHFWWDAPGPSASNPGGAQKLGEAPLDGMCMAEVSSLRVPPSAVCTAHTVYAFIVGSNGLPHPDTTASVAFRVTGCATGSSSPTPMPSASSPPPTAGSAGSSDDSGLGTAGVVGIISAALLATVAGFYLARRFLAKRHRQGVDAA